MTKKEYIEQLETELENLKRDYIVLAKAYQELNNSFWLLQKEANKFHTNVIFYVSTQHIFVDHLLLHNQNN